MAKAGLEGRCALITGGARRLGRAITLALAGDGSDVVIHYSTSADEAASLAEEAASLGVKAHTTKADLADGPESLIERAFEAAGSIDILVNSASIFPEGTLADITFEDLKENIAVNAWAPFALTRAFAGKASKGSVINLLDTRIIGFDRAHAAYAFSKQMLAQMTTVAALEYAPGITVNGVAPGLVMPPEGKDDSYLERISGALPLKRHGSPEDVTRAVLFLLKSGFVTGQVIYVDGGRHLREFMGASRPKGTE